MITLKNFQGHVDSSLDIQRPGINVLVGKSRAGKSAIVRAVEALCGQGPMYRRRGSKETRVEWNGCARIRSNSKNEFDVDGVIYKAMRSDTPKELQDRLRLSEINFRPQHQPYFLLAESPGAVAREMNKLADLGMIDYVVGTLKKSLKDTEDEIKTAQGNAGILQKKVAGFDWAVAADEDLKVIAQAEQSVAELGNRVNALKNVCIELEKIEDYLDFMPPTSTVWISDLEARLSTDKLEALKQSVAEIEEVESWLDSLPPDTSQELVRVSGRVESAIDPSPLQKLCEELAELEYELGLVPDIDADLAAMDAIVFPSQLEELSRLVAVLESLPDYSGLGEWELGIWRISNKINRIDYLNEEIIQLRGQVHNFFSYSNEADIRKAEQAELEVEFNNLLAEAGVCPLCLRGVE